MNTSIGIERIGVVNFKMRVAFPLFGGASWSGGLNYLVNLFSALAESAPGAITPIVFTGTDRSSEELAPLLPHLSEPPVRLALWNAGSWTYKRRLFCGVVLQRDGLAEQAFRDANIDLAFQHADLYGSRFGIPTLAWIADFQHRHLPHMFSKLNYLRRELGYHVLARSATQILVSSQDAARDCKKFYPAAEHRISVLPFTAPVANVLNRHQLEILLSKYRLPERFFFLPNQFWKHKNHVAVVQALQIAKLQGESLVVAATGNLKDPRHPNYPSSIIDQVKHYGLNDNFRYLGMIPREDIYPLMQASIGLINPSLFEGWSTTVEEAKALGVPLILSDLRVHKEQAPTAYRYFNANDPSDLAVALSQAWHELPPGPRPDAERAALFQTQEKREAFAHNFIFIANKTVEMSNANK